jgi:hypothetical protein
MSIRQSYFLITQAKDILMVVVLPLLAWIAGYEMHLVREMNQLSSLQHRQSNNGEYAAGIEVHGRLMIRTWAHL